MIIQEDITFLYDRLAKYGVDVSKLNNASLAVINELCRVTWKLTEDTIKSISNYFMIDSKYRKYIELKNSREVHSPIKKCI